MMIPNMWYYNTPFVHGKLRWGTDNPYLTAGDYGTNPKPVDDFWTVINPVANQRRIRHNIICVFGWGAAVIHFILIRGFLGQWWFDEIKEWNADETISIKKYGEGKRFIF